MKAYKDYTNQYRIKVVFFIILFFVLGFLYSSAQNKEELESKISAKNNDISSLEAQIKGFQTEINNLSKQKNSLDKALKELELNRKKLSLNINLTENKIEATQLTIEKLDEQIDIKKGEIDLNKKALIENFRKLDEIENTNLIVMFLKESSITDFWNQADQLISFRENIRSRVIDLNETKTSLENNQNEEEKAALELTLLKNKLTDENKIIQENKKQTEKLLRDTKNSESNYQKLLKERRALKDAIEKELRDYESQLKFILDPNSLPGANVLSWPLDNVFVTQQFGVTSASKRLYASGSHSGTDFRASVGTPVKAMAEGIIKAVGDTDTTCAGASFGKWILIDYNNGLSSAYGHLSLTKSSVGQKVSRGEVVAYSGNTGHTTGPHLHVTVYVKNAVKVESRPSRACPGKTLTQPFAPVNAYLDPMYYLPKN